MTLQQALAFRLPDGKPLSEATPKVWQKAQDFYVNELKRFETLERSMVTQADCQRVQLALEHSSVFLEAVSVIVAHLASNEECATAQTTK